MDKTVQSMTNKLKRKESKLGVETVHVGPLSEEDDDSSDDEVGLKLAASPMRFKLTDKNLLQVQKKTANELLLPELQIHEEGLQTSSMNNSSYYSEDEDETETEPNDKGHESK